MKRNKKVALFLIYCIFGIILLSMFEPTILVDSSSDTYFLVNENATPLYISPNEKIENNIKFGIDKSYFVREIQDYDDYLKVEYNGIVGYVKKESVTRVAETPLSPYALGTMRANNNCKIYSECNKNSTSLITLPENYELNYIGKMTGNIENDLIGNVWFFVNVNYNDISHTGYVYLGDVHAITGIDFNNESTTSVNGSKLSAENLLNLNLTAQTIMIIVTVIPTLILVIGLLKGVKLQNT